MITYEQILKETKDLTATYTGISAEDIEGTFPLDNLSPIEVVEVVMWLELRYDIDIDDVLILELQTVADLATLVDNML